MRFPYPMGELIQRPEFLDGVLVYAVQVGARFLGGLDDPEQNQLYSTTGVYSPTGVYEYSQITYQLFNYDSVTLSGAEDACTAMAPSFSLPCATINADGVVTLACLRQPGRPHHIFFSRRKQRRTTRYHYLDLRRRRRTTDQGRPRREPLRRECWELHHGYCLQR
jgi:hypothetical protein